MNVKLIPLVTVFGLAACGQVQPSFTVKENGVARDDTYLLTTQRCAIHENSQESALGAALATAALGVGIDVLAAALDESAKAGETPVTDVTTANIVADINSAPTCLTLWRGPATYLRTDREGNYIGGPDKSVTPFWFKKWSDAWNTANNQSVSADDRWKTFATTFEEEGLDIVGSNEPDFFFQGRLIYASAPTTTGAMKLAPEIIAYKSPLILRATGTTRSISVAVGITKPGDAVKNTGVVDIGGLASGDIIAFSSIDVSSIAKCSEFYGALRDIEGAKKQVSASKATLKTIKDQIKKARTSKEKEAAKTKLAKEQLSLRSLEAKLSDAKTLANGFSNECAKPANAKRAPLESAWFQADIPTEKAARIVTVTTTELAKKDAALAFAAALLKAVKDPVTGAVKTALTPSESFSDDAAYFTQKGNLAAALVTCASSGTLEDFFKAQAAAETLQLAALTADQNQITVSLSKPEDCGSALATLN